MQSRHHPDGGQHDAPERVDVVKRHDRLLRRTALVSFLTLISRIVGLVRETLTAAIFGDRSAINDAFVTAWRVPNLFRALMGEGAITTSLQQALTRTDHERGEEAGRRLFHAIMKTVMVFAVIVTGIAVAIALLLPDAMPITGWRWLGADPEPVRDLTARMLPFVLFMCGASVAGGALQVRGHFLAPALAPSLMNLCWIGALFFTAHTYGWGGSADETPPERFARHFDMARMIGLFVLGAGAVFLLVHLPPLARRGLWGARAGAAPAARVSSSEVWAILRSTLPLAFGAAVFQINVLISGFLAEGLLPNGGPTALYYAARLQQFPLSIVSAAATSAVFPSLAALGQVGDRAGLKRLHDETHLAIAFVAVPATIGLFVFAGPVCAVCFGHGAFGDEGVARTAAALQWLTLAILPAGATGLLARAYYAIGDYSTPVRCAVVMLVLNTVLSVVLVAGLHMDADGLALATAITAWGNLALLGPLLRRRLGVPPAERAVGRPGPGFRLSRIVLAAALSVGLAFLTHQALGRGPDSALALGLAIGVALCSYGTCALLLHLPEAEHLLSRLRPR